MFVVSALVVAVSTSTVAVPAQADSVMLVYDASYSMLDRLPDGRVRLAVARQAVAEVLENWQTGTPLGLVAYGHRTRVCDDVELVIPPGSMDPTRASAAVRQLQPYGLTPLIAAIEMAADAIADADGQRSVVVITDGGENCRPDPCGDARRLAQRVDVQVHIIAFDMHPAESAIISCIADATEGLFLRADDAESLAAALSGALARTGLAGAIYNARLRAEQTARLIDAGDDTLERIASDRSSVQEQFTVYRDSSGGVLEQLAEDAALWSTLDVLINRFIERERAMMERALQTGDERFFSLARMWAERARQTRVLMDDVRSERARAAGFLRRIDEDAFMVGQLVTLGLADEAIDVLRRVRDEVAGLNDSLTRVFDEVDRMMGQEAVEH